MSRRDKRLSRSVPGKHGIRWLNTVCLRPLLVLYARRTRRALLHHVGQLVREQALSIRPFRGIAASAKYHLIRNGVSVCVDR